MAGIFVNFYQLYFGINVRFLISTYTDLLQNPHKEFLKLYKLQKY